MGNELKATYYILGKTYNIFGCWDNETPENEFDFYDVCEKDGTCINEGEPFYQFPTYDELREYIEKVVNK